MSLQSGLLLQTRALTRFCVLFGFYCRTVSLHSYVGYCLFSFTFSFLVFMLCITLVFSTVFIEERLIPYLTFLSWHYAVE